MVKKAINKVLVPAKKRLSLETLPKNVPKENKIPKAINIEYKNMLSEGIKLNTFKMYGETIKAVAIKGEKPLIIAIKIGAILDAWA